MISPTYTHSSSTTTNDAWYVAVVCPRCKGNHHLQECPQVRAVEYHEDGIRIKRVEFLTPGDYMPAGGIQPIPLGPVTWKAPYDITVTTTHTAKYDDDAQIFWTVT